MLLSLGVNALGAWRIDLSNKYPAYWILPAFGLLGGTIAGLLVQRVAPEASGSGIPQVRAALDRLKMPLDWRIAVVKLVGGTIALGSGLFMGREGPTVQLGAAIAATLSKYSPGAKQYRRQLIAAGAGAGLAAAFNAPLAGAVFVLEELLKEIKPTTVVIALAASSTAALAVQLLWPPNVHPTAHLLASQIYFRSKYDLPWYVLLALICALAGAAFNNGILFSLNLYRRAKFLPLALKVGLAGLISGTIIAFTPESFHDYAFLRGLIVSGLENWQTVAMAVVEFYILSLVAYGSGAPGGLFAPSLAIGASLGFLTGCLENLVMPGASTAAFSLVGMGAFFGAVARVPLTAIVITFELTGSFTLLIPLMISCVLASAVGEWVSPNSLYERLMEWNGLHLHRQSGNNGAGAGGSGGGNPTKTKVKDIFVKRGPTVGSKTLVKDLLQKLTEQRYQGMPVVDNRILVGVVRQENVTNLLHLGEMSDSLTVAELMTSHPVSVSPLETLEDILHLFTHHHFNWLPVTENDRFYGVIYQNDVVRALFSAEEMGLAKTTVERVIDTSQEESLDKSEA